MIAQIEPSYGPEEARAAYDLIMSGSWLTEHTATRELEAAIAEFLQVDHCIMMPNCTLALYAALHVTGAVDSIVPDFTMAATAQAVTMADGMVDLTDVDGISYCIDVSIAGNRIDFFTDTIIPVHLNGRSCDIDGLISLGHTVIEDAAQAFGSRHNSKYLGTFGAIGCFSFSPHKIISTGQGGCCVTNSAVIADRLRRFKLYGRVPGTRHSYDRYGTNLKFTDLQAVVGLEQMKRLRGRIERKKAMYDRYEAELSTVDEVGFVKTDLTQTVPWYVDILVDDPVALSDFLHGRGIGTQLPYEPLHLQPPFSQQGKFPNSVHYATHALWLPSSVTLRDQQIDYVCDTIKDYYRGAK